MTKPSDRAEELMRTVDLAHAKLKTAWHNQTTDHLTTGQTSTGRITSSRIPDPSSDTAHNIVQRRTDCLTEVVEATAELAQVDAIDANPAPVYRCRRLVDVLALHRQWTGRLFTLIRQYEADPTGWDDAHTLTGTLASHAHTIHRLSRWHERRLLLLDAEPGTDVCDSDHCQRVATEGIYCRTCHDRRERAQTKQEQRRRQVRADREAGIRCHGELGRTDPEGRRCEALLSDTDQQRNRRHCGACRTWASRHVGTGGTFTWQEAL